MKHQHLLVRLQKNVLVQIGIYYQEYATFSYPYMSGQEEVEGGCYVWFYIKAGISCFW